jgi:hypothetical protein
MRAGCPIVLNNSAFNCCSAGPTKGDASSPPDHGE